MKKNLICCVLLILACANQAIASEHCSRDLERLPIQAAGRVKPLRVHAKDVIKFISGKNTCGELSAVEAYCELSLADMIGTLSECKLQIRVDHQNTRAFLGLVADEGTIDPARAIAGLPSLRAAYTDLQAQKEEKSARGKDLATTVSRIALYQDLVAGTDWMVPVVHDDQTHWITVRDLYTIKQEQLTVPSEMTALIEKFATSYRAVAGDRYLLELTYDKLQLFSWAMLATVLALGIAALSRQGVNVGLLASVGIIFILEITAIAMRVMISGRGPVTNMYETVMWVGIGSLLFATILSLARKEKIFILCGLGLNLLCLFMINFAHSMLDPSISPLVPVLRDNFWLSTHVTTITISYAAFALSWGLANYFMVRRLVTHRDDDLRYMSLLIYDAVKIGVVLIALGVILGGIWADYSWGRFWGWDPKETWALIVLMTYIAILHGRHAGWIRERQFIPLVGFAFLTVIMAWFGVNYILATGLHSYGFSEGGTLFIAALVLVQLSILIIYAVKTRKS